MNGRAILTVLAALVTVSVASGAVRKAPKKARATVAAPAAAGPVQSAHRKDPYVGAVAALEVQEPVRQANGSVVKRTVWKTVYANGADAEAYPASVTKLMTLLLVLEDVRSGRYALNAKVTATPDVNRCEPSWVGLKAGDVMTVRDLCLALMVESANDAAIALGVHSAGSFDAFVGRMNARARELGMAATRYYNPNGLPPNGKRRYPWKSFNVTSAADQLKLAVALLGLPETIAFTSVKTCDLVKTGGGFRISVTRIVNEPMRQTTLLAGETLVKQMRNHNNILVKDKLHLHNVDGTETVDGLKTGYINAGGSSVVITGRRNGRRAVVVVLGSASSEIRDANASRLLQDAFGAMGW